MRVVSYIAIGIIYDHHTLDVANGIIILPFADRFLMNASVCAALMLLIFYVPIMITSKRDLCIKHHNSAVLIDNNNKINAAKCSTACVANIS